MPIAYNKETGEILTLGDDGKWAPPKMAQNPETGQKLFLDGSEWKPLPAMAGLSAKDKTIEQNSFMPRVQAALEQGATMGFSDEVGAAGAATGRFLKDLTSGQPVADAWKHAGERYDERLAGQRALSKEFARDNPGTNMALETLGGFSMGPKQQPMSIAGTATLPPAQSATLPQMALQGAKVGATYGGVTGFGTGEGGFGDRAANAAIGAGAGAAVGAATPVIAQGLAHGWDVAKNLVGATDPDKTAQQLILRAMERDGMSPQDAAQRFQQWQASGAKPEALVDIGGENVRGLMRGAASVPGPAKEAAQTFIEQRQAEQGSRIAKDVADMISPNTDFAGTVDNLMQSRARMAQPIYEKAVNPANLVPDDEFAKLAADPFIAKTIGQVRSDPLYGMGEIPPNSMPVLDAAKKQIDDAIGAAVRAGRNNEARLLGQKKDAIVSLADSAFPDYAAARQAWSGPSQSMEAMDLGRSILKADADVTARQIAALPAGDKEFFRAGVVKAIKDTADKVQDGGDITKRIFGNKAIREKLAAAFDTPADFSAFENAIKREANMFATNQQIGPRQGSRTAVLESEMQDVRKNPIVQFAADVFHRGPFQAVGGAASHLYDRGRGINAETSQALARYLLETNPNSVHNVFSTVQGTQNLDRARAAAIARQLQLIGAQEGRMAGGATY